MPIEQTLRRVDADLADGRVLHALGRLGNLQRAHPGRLDLRVRLAVVYRDQGEAAQAGRWSFLDELPHPDEIAAFERQFRTARGRLRALRWDGDAGLLGPHATARLRDLRARSDAEGQADDAPDATTGADWGCMIFAAVALMAAALLVIGAATVVRWLAG